MKKRAELLPGSPPASTIRSPVTGINREEAETISFELAPSPGSVMFNGFPFATTRRVSLINLSQVGLRIG